VPTTKEAGLSGYESAAWFAFLAPKGTPRPIIDAVNKAVAEAMSDSGVRARFSELGAEPVATKPEELGRFISEEVVKWREVITKGKIKLEGQ
jgi:tripartite-type tricarboxylate transporter receptor subunit TctC